MFSFLYIYALEELQSKIVLRLFNVDHDSRGIVQLFLFRN